MKLFSRFFGTDEEKAVLDRRLFLVGATITLSGLIVPKTIIPRSMTRVLPLPSWTPSLTRYYFFDSDTGGDACDSNAGYPYPIPQDWRPLSDLPKLPQKSGNRIVVVSGKQINDTMIEIAGRGSAW